MATNDKIFLSLSGGAARGLNHIYMLKYFKQHDFKIDGIVGTSAGSIVAALYAYGMTFEEMQNVFNDIKKLSRKFWKFISLYNIFKANGFLKTTPIFDYFNNLFNKAHIEDLKIPFGCVTYNLEQGEPCYIKSGNLASAVTYSITFPILFKLHFGSLCDGGISDNCPAVLARQMGADKVIALDLHRDLNNDNSYKTSKFKTIARLIRCLWSEAQENNENAADLIVKIHSTIGFFGFDEFDKAEISAQTAFTKNLEKIKEIYN